MKCRTDGLPCPTCGEGDNRVLDKRNTQHDAIRRRRECLSCGTKFTTKETVVSDTAKAVCSAPLPPEIEARDPRLDRVRWMPGTEVEDV